MRSLSDLIEMVHAEPVKGEFGDFWFTEGVHALFDSRLDGWCDASAETLLCAVFKDLG